LLLTQNRFLEAPAGQFYAAQIATTLSYIHSQGIVYRDLKPENMMIGKDGYLKIIDFGLSKRIEKEKYSTGKTLTMCGTPNYIAPEILQSKPYGYEADWWSYGVVLYEIFYGQMPFQGNTPSELFKNILNGKPRLSPRIDNRINKLIKGLLRKDPKKRYGAKKVLEHEFFKSMDFEKLQKKKLEVPFFPSVKSASDTKNFAKVKVPRFNMDNCPELSPEEDIFQNW